MPPPPVSSPDAISPSRAIGRTHDCSSVYPIISRMLSEQGDVLVRYDVDEKGTIRNVAIEKPSGSDRLDRAALACVSALWRNTPAARAGVPIASPGHQAIVRFTVTQPVAAVDFEGQAMAYNSIGDLDRAMTIFDRALTMDPKSPELRVARGWTQFMRGDLDTAQAEFNAALKLKPHQQAAEDGLALIQAERTLVRPHNDAI